MINTAKKSAQVTESSSNIQSIALVCCADNNYAMPLAVTICSVLKSLSSNCYVSLFIIDGGISNRNKKRLIKSVDVTKCNINFTSVTNSLLEKSEILDAIKFRLRKDSSFFGHVSIQAYYKCFLAELLPANLGKVIYLDCDLFVRGNLCQLWKEDIGENYVLAVQDIFSPLVSSPNALGSYKQLGIPSDYKYFNSGVLVINLKKWRENGIISQAVQYIRNYHHLDQLHDQDVLNAIFAGHWGELDLRWNVTPGIHHYASCEESPFSEEVFASLFSDPYIVHYTTGAKPWSTSKTGFGDSFLYKDLFFHYLDMTDWSGWRLTPRRLIQAKINRKLNRLKRLF